MKTGPLKAIFFDFDGTLTRPGSIDYTDIKKRIRCPQDRGILEYISGIVDPEKRRAAQSILDELEKNAARHSAPNRGAGEIIRHAKKKGLLTGIITRNSLSSLKISLSNFKEFGEDDFDLIISRDDPFPPKPSGTSLIAAADRFGIEGGQILVVGDFDYDIQAGKEAGTITVLLDPARRRKPALKPDFVISDLLELKGIIRRFLPLSCGKLPNDLLNELIEGMGGHDPSVIVGPTVGQDFAAVNVKDAEVVVLKSDPITFATDSIGKYAVIVNANDIVTSGAIPRWFLTTLLFPPGSTPEYIRSITTDLELFCKRFGITLCGGHTEITDAVSRPIVSGMMAGTVTAERLIDKKAVKAGDAILLTKGVSVEGTAIIAREFEEELVKKGMAREDIALCKDFLNLISVLEEAAIAAESGIVTSMHDVTEGGLATAAYELSESGGHRLNLDMDLIHIYPETKKICRILGLDPLGLIGSGSLLITCREKGAKELEKEISNAGIRVARIGTVGEKGIGIDAVKNKRPFSWPEFKTDELTRLFG